MKNWIRNFIKGIGSVLNLAPEPISLEFQSDEEAIASDFRRVGDDIRKVMDNNPNQKG